MNALAGSANDEVVRIEQWAADIPDEPTAQHTGLALTRVARAVAGGDSEVVAYWIDTAEKAIGSADAQHQQVLRVSVALWHAVAAYTTGDLELTAEQCQAVLAMGGPGTNVNAFYAQGILGASLFATSGPEAALPHLQQGAATRRRLSLHDGRTTAQLAAVHAELGDWEQAETIAAEAFSLPIPEGHEYPYNAPAHYAMAQVHSHRGDTDEAIAHAEIGLTMARPGSARRFCAGACS
jgi:tetratricopeptide (TPR) repeat protein